MRNEGVLYESVYTWAGAASQLTEEFNEREHIGKPEL
jgi:hypothetical protein